MPLGFHFGFTSPYHPTLSAGTPVRAEPKNGTERPELLASNGAPLSIETTMSDLYRPHPPPETLDHIVNLLHDKQDSLKRCCFVSKLWVPRTRKHLFSGIEFRSAAVLELWKKTFRDQPNSPAYHTHTLLVGFHEDITTADAERSGWIR